VDNRNGFITDEVTNVEFND